MKALFDPTQLSLKRQKTLVKKITTVYWELGTPGATPLILLHGITGTHHGLLPLAQRLQDYHMFVPDIPGHGETDIPPEHTRKSIVDWFIAFVRMVGDMAGRPPIVVSHSYGAQVAFEACRQLGEDYAKCVLLTPVPRVSIITYLYGKAFNFLPGKMAIDIAKNERVHTLRDDYMLVRHSPDIKKLVHWISENSVYTPDKATFMIKITQEIFEALAFDADDAQRGRFYCISGDHDRIVDAKSVEILKKTFGNDHCFVCTNTGHLMPIEAPDDAAALIRPLLPKA